MPVSFHLSIGVRSIAESKKFFAEVLGATLTHEEATYVSYDLYGSQISLKPNPSIDPFLPDFHFGINLSFEVFEQLSEKICRDYPEVIKIPPHVVDADTPLERKKMYLNSPTGYLVELKAFRSNAVP